ncbi:hypothetical protein [Myxococcus sp. CA018]|nr:hypothetical protein [Myxococcus sp. CA018]
MPIQSRRRAHATLDLVAVTAHVGEPTQAAPVAAAQGPLEWE